MVNEPDELTEMLRGLRDRRGWTQAHLADAVGVSSSMVGNVEGGAREFAEDTLGDVAKALGATDDELVRLIQAQAARKAARKSKRRRRTTVEVEHDALEQISAQLAEITDRLRRLEGGYTESDDG